MKNLLLFIIAIISISVTYAQNIGINTPMPTHTLDVNGSLRVRGGAPGANKILTSDANGVGSWANILPIDYSQTNSGTILNITNTNTNSYHTFIARNNTDVVGAAVYGIATFTGPNTYSIGVKGENLSTSFGGAGVQGFHNGSGNGVQGYSANGAGGYFGSNNGYALITAGGNVGIGTSTPAAKMDIQGTDYLSHFYYGTNEDTYIRGGKAGSRVLINDITGQGSVGIGIANPNQYLDVNGRMRLYHTGPQIGPTATTAGIWLNNANNNLGIADGAFVGINCSAAGSETIGIFVGGQWRFDLDRAGNGRFGGTVTASTGFACASDLRYKKDIKPLVNALSSIEKINGVSYNWRKKEFPDKNFTDQNQIGFIAQDLEKVYPEMVFTDAKGYKSVDYARLTPVLVEAIKELKKENDSLKTENNSFKNNQTKLENRIDKMESLLNSFSKNTASN